MRGGRLYLPQKWGNRREYPLITADKHKRASGVGYSKRGIKSGSFQEFSVGLVDF